MLFCRIGPLAGNHIFRIDRFTVKTASDPKGMPSTSYFAQIVNWLIFFVICQFYCMHYRKVFTLKLFSKYESHELPTKGNGLLIASKVFDRV